MDKNRNINTPRVNKDNKIAQYLQVPQNLKTKVTEPSFLSFLAGFFEGEGSLSVSITVSAKAKYGIILAPAFGVTQNINGIFLLQSFWVLFGGKGSLHPKHGSSHVWTYELKGISNIIKYVFPFMLTYVMPHACKTNEFLIFQQLVIGMEKKEHLDKEKLKDLVILAYSYTGKGNNRKRSLEEILSIIDNKQAYFDQNPESVMDEESEV